MTEVPQADLDEARRILLIAKERGVLLRLFGGLAVQVHCREVQFCDRKHADIDLVGLSGQSAAIKNIIEGEGYTENAQVNLSMGWKRMLFQKPDSEDHVDVFLDRLTFEHEIDLRGRLGIEELTVSVSDLLLSKLSIARLNEKDLTDIVTILKERPVADHDLPGAVNIEYITRLCSRRWGLCHDVLKSVEECINWLSTHMLEPESCKRALRTLETLRESISDSKKSIGWRVRAVVGEHMSWRKPLEEPGAWAPANPAR